MAAEVAVVAASLGGELRNSESKAAAAAEAHARLVATTRQRAAKMLSAKDAV